MQEFFGIYSRLFGWFDTTIAALLLTNVVFIWSISRSRARWGISVPRQKQFSQVCLELFPVIGILGTVYGLSRTLAFMGAEPLSDIGPTMERFGEALTTTFSGLFAVGISLVAETLTERDAASHE